MQLGRDILAERLQGLSRDDFAARDGLDDDLEHLAVNVLGEFLHPFLAQPLGLRGVDDARDGVDGHLVDVQLQFGDGAGFEAGVFVVEAGVAFGRGLEFAEEVVD